MISSARFDGTFAFRRADKLNPWDVVFQPVRQVLHTANDAASDTSVITTSIGAETHDSAARMWTFRPADAEPGECAACGADPRRPCDPTVCPGLAVLEDHALDPLNHDLGDHAVPNQLTEQA